MTSERAQNTRPRAQAARILTDIPAALDNFEKTIYKAKQNLPGGIRVCPVDIQAIRVPAQPGRWKSIIPLGKGLNDAEMGLTVADVVIVALPQIKPLLP